MSARPSTRQAPRGAVADWIATHAAQSGLRVVPIPFADCAHWRFDAGCLRHDSGRYFSVIGFRCVAGPAHLLGLQMPMIDQPEIGILGFVVRRDAAGWQWLLQAKTEPGNVGGTQVGPSVQATFSNYTRVHGGRATPLLELFIGPGSIGGIRTDVEQSEQGDRFLGKFNRNMVVEVTTQATPDSPNWRWFTAHELRAALHADFLLNTDSRSVLFCADWSLLADAASALPFARWQGSTGFGAQLLRSSLDEDADASARAVGARLETARDAQPIACRRVRLDALAGWQLTATSISAEGRDPEVRAYAISAPDREVPQWCQPLLGNRRQGRVVLACARRAGLLQFLLSVSFEPGFREHAQLGPSLVCGIGHAPQPALLGAIDAPGSQLHARVLQSDEGGRFMHSIARYEIVELAADSGPADGVWVSLATLRVLAARRGLLTNELRSACSLLLHWV